MSPAGDKHDMTATLQRIAGLSHNVEGGRGELQARLRAIHNEAQAALARSNPKRKESK